MKETGTLVDALAGQARTTAGIRYLQSGDRQSRISYAELMQRASGLLARLQRRGLKPGDPVQLHVFVDRGVLEVYCNGVAVTHRCFAPADLTETLVFSEGGEAALAGLEAWKMKPLWE